MSTMAILMGLYLALHYLTNIINKNRLIDKTIRKFEDSQSICNRCGRDVSLGSELWSNRLRDKDNFENRKLKGAKFPAGNFIYGDCQEKIQR
ncbi:MAG: hypothetical protein KDC52_08120 [Ignavibacteriae bacterium]|nr:hypothetical protein [Ignavibacteriota bacterium]MCB9211657.1 hypothetical protein [Ignavibacteriales bacterium]